MWCETQPMVCSVIDITLGTTRPSLIIVLAHDLIDLRGVIMQQLNYESEIIHRGNYGSDEAVLKSILRVSEKIKATVYGFANVGFMLMAITNERIIFVDKKFMYEDIQEISFESVTGISYDKRLLFIDITLATGSGDVTIRTLNNARAKGFIGAVEAQCLRGTSIARSAA